MEWFFQYDCLYILFYKLSAILKSSYRGKNKTEYSKTIDLLLFFGQMVHMSGIVKEVRITDLTVKIAQRARNKANGI
jgi:hypothetical protein